MKRAAPWEEALTISSSDSSDSDSDGDPLSVKKGGSRSLPKGIMSEALRTESNSRKKKIGGMDFEALSRHGYHGGPSILKVPPPRVEEKDQDWSWSTGKRSSKEEEEAKESYEERERTRAISQGEKILNMQTSNSPFGKKEKSKSFSQKEKKKRDLGQASRGKNYVEEEKRLLRDSGVYSGFDV